MSFIQLNLIQEQVQSPLNQLKTATKDVFSLAFVKSTKQRMSTLCFSVYHH